MSVARVSKALVRLSIPDGQALMEPGLWDWTGDKNLENYSERCQNNLCRNLGSNLYQSYSTQIIDHYGRPLHDQLAV